jgi:parvulin-like peptidyl-prolyl isomerase
MNLYSKILNTYLTKTLLLIYFFTGYSFNSSFCADNSKNDTLALVGKKVITTEDFITSYKDKIARIGLTDNGETRINYLMNLVSDELLIAESRNRGLDKTEVAQKEYKRIWLQELLNAYSLKHISPNISVTEEDLIELFTKLNTKIKVRHLYAPTKEKADLLYDELISGKKFEELAKENFEDYELRNNGGSLGYISVDEMDPDFEKAAYSMRIGEISKPVKTVQGYSIIRVDDIKSNPLLTENEFLKARDRLNAFARKRKYEEAAKKFAEALNNKLNVVLNDKVIAKIYNVLQKKPYVDITETPSMMLQENLNEIVVYSELGNWDLETLINEMSLVSEKQKKFIRTRENLEDLISGLVNRKYIEQEAVKEKLDKTPSFYKNVEFNFDTYLLTTIEEELKRQIYISPDSIKSYYSKNINLFKTKPAVRLSSILVDNSVNADSIELLLEKGILFEELSKKYSVQTLTSEDGGDMGFFKEDELGELANSLFALTIGQWAGPFSDFDKYVFLKCTDLKGSTTMSFDESKREIKETLVSFEWFNVRDQFVESLKNDISYWLYPQKLYGIKF